MAHNTHVATYQRQQAIYKGVTVAQHFKNDLPDFGRSVVIRLGGTLSYDDYEVHINSAKAVKNSVNKLKQKNLLLKANIATLPVLVEPIYPCVVKGVIRSGGTSVFIANNKHEFDIATNTINGEHIIEPLFKATSEYRLHCTRDEVFFAVKKHKRNPDDVIINRDNHFNKMEFVKPRLWQQIQADCLNAMKALDLDIACFDVMYSSVNDAKHEFYIAEANTNPELLHNTYNAYLKAIIKIAKKKIEALPKEVRIAKPILRGKLNAEQKLRVIAAIQADDYWINDDGGVLSIKL
jgi:RimK-like ATP-grasp domain